MLALDAIDAVRRHLRQTPALDENEVPTEDVSTDDGTQGSARTEFSDEHLLRLIWEAETEITRTAKAQHVPQAVTRIDGPFAATAGGGDSNLGHVLRLLYGRVHVGADAPTSGTYDPGGYNPDTLEPGDVVYELATPKPFTLESGWATADAAAGATLQVTVDGVPAGTLAVSASGPQLTDFSDAEVPDGAVVAVTLLSGSAAGVHVQLTGTLAQIPEAGYRAAQVTADAQRRLRASGRSATPEFPSYVWEDGVLSTYPEDQPAYAFFVVAPPEITLAQADAGAQTTLPPLLEAALVYHATSACHRQMGQVELSDLWESLYVSEMTPYARTTRLSAQFDDAEVSVE